MESSMTEQSPEQPQAPEPQQPAPEQSSDTFKSEESKQAVLADLHTERKQRQALERQMTELQNAQRAQTEALAKAFGLKDGEKPEADKLAEQVSTLQSRIDAAERKSRILELASENGIPKNYLHLLTGQDDETLTAQATAVAELVKGRAAGTPQPDPTQGAMPTSTEAAAEAEYRKFFPSSPSR